MTNFKTVAGVLSIILALAIATLVTIQQGSISKLTHRVAELESKLQQPSLVLPTIDRATETLNDNPPIDSPNDQASREAIREKIKNNKVQLNEYIYLANELDLEIRKVLSSSNGKNDSEGS